MTTLTGNATRIAELNDRFRRSFSGGQLYFTRGVDGHGVLFVWRAVAAVQAFDAFTPDNDPYGEHDFGAFTLDGEKLFWKIDTYADGSLSFFFRLGGVIFGEGVKGAIG